MTNKIVAGLLGCVILSAIGGFGAPFFCGNNSNDKCLDAWRGAAAGALTAAGTLGGLLARLDGTKD